MTGEIELYLEPRLLPRGRRGRRGSNANGDEARLGSERREERIRIAREKLKERANVRKRQFEKTTTVESYRRGDLVWCKIHRRSDARRRTTRKIHLVYDGPYRIRNVVRRNAYELEQLNGTFFGVYNSRQLRPHRASRYENDNDNARYGNDDDDDNANDSNASSDHDRNHEVNYITRKEDRNNVRSDNRYRARNRNDPRNARARHYYDIARDRCRYGRVNAKSGVENYDDDLPRINALVIMPSWKRRKLREEEGEWKVPGWRKKQIEEAKKMRRVKTRKLQSEETDRSEVAVKFKCTGIRFRGDKWNKLIRSRELKRLKTANRKKIQIAKIREANEEREKAERGESNASAGRAVNDAECANGSEAVIVIEEEIDSQTVGKRVAPNCMVVIPRETRKRLFERIAIEARYADKEITIGRTDEEIMRGTIIEIEEEDREPRSAKISKADTRECETQSEAKDEVEDNHVEKRKRTLVTVNITQRDTEVIDRTESGEIDSYRSTTQLSESRTGNKDTETAITDKVAREVKKKRVYTTSESRDSGNRRARADKGRDESARMSVGSTERSSVVNLTSCEMDREDSGDDDGCRERELARRQARVTECLNERIRIAERFRDACGSVRRAEAVLEDIRRKDVPDVEESVLLRRSTAKMNEAVRRAEVIFGETRQVTDRVCLYDDTGKLRTEIEMQFTVKQHPGPPQTAQTYGITYEYDDGNVRRTAVNVRTGANIVRDTGARKIGAERAIMPARVTEERGEADESLQPSTPSTVKREEEDATETSCPSEGELAVPRAIPLTERPNVTETDPQSDKGIRAADDEGSETEESRAEASVSEDEASQPPILTAETATVRGDAKAGCLAEPRPGPSRRTDDSQPGPSREREPSPVIGAISVINLSDDESDVLSFRSPAFSELTASEP
ncbi:PREDICTED: uncharacterized protein LOC108781678, partial [Cyphomyrmex costatus]|uniref:uncharacterized protein LOC108781678 n=1 Tax=Cyphomyrmex costatus TaxID=456900 RepID=UPI0008522F83